MTGIVLAGLCVLSFSLVTCSPTDLHTVKKRANNLPLVPGDEDAQALGLMKHKKWRLEPIKVEQVEAFTPSQSQHKLEITKPVVKRSQSPLQSFSKSQTYNSAYSNINGKVHERDQENAEVARNGKVLSSFRHSGVGSGEPGQKPHVQAFNELDIPGLNLHKKVLEKDGEVYPVQQDEEMVLQVAEDLAEYVRVTGDDVGVIAFFKELIQNDKMPEEEGLMYLELVSALLADQPDNKRMDEDEPVEREDDDERVRNEEAELILNFSDYIDGKYQAGEIPSKVYKQLKDKLMMTVLEKVDMDPKFLFGAQGQDKPY